MTQLVTGIVPAQLISAVNHTYYMLGMADHVASHTKAAWTDGTTAYAMFSGQWTDTQLAGVTQVSAALQAGISAHDALKGFPLFEQFYSEYGDKGVALVGDAALVFDIWQDGDEKVPAAPLRVTAAVYDRPHDFRLWSGVYEKDEPNEE